MGATGGRLTLFDHDGDFFCYMVTSKANDGYSFVVMHLRSNTRDEFSINLDEQVRQERQLRVTSIRRLARRLLQTRS